MSTGPAFLRLFVAAPVPEEVKAALTEAQREMREALSGGTTAWTRPEAMHLTVRFLGAVEEARALELERRLREGLPGFGPLELRCRGLGCFPHARRPRVVWAGVDDAGDLLPRLHDRVNRAADEFASKPAEARFVGHVTLARPKVIRRPDVERLVAFVARAVDRPFGSWRCEELALIRSEPAATGSRYTTLARLAL